MLTKPAASGLQYMGVIALIIGIWMLVAENFGGGLFAFAVGAVLVFLGGRAIRQHQKRSPG